MLQIEIIYFPDESDSPQVLCSLQSPHVPHIGEVLLLQSVAGSDDLSPGWEVVDVSYIIQPQLGSIAKVIIYVEPAEPSEEEE